MAYSTPQEYQDYLKNKLNPFERFSDLLSGKDDRQDFTNILLFNLLQLAAGIVPGSGGSGGGSGTINVVFPPLVVTQEEIMTGMAALTTDEIKPQKMADCRKAYRILLSVNNGFNQEVQVNVKGNTSSNHDSAKLIHTFNISAGENGAYGFSFEEWMPYVACTVTPVVAPTLGTVNASVIKQEAS